MKHLIDNLEIYLTAAGLVVIFAAGAAVRRFEYWQVLGVTAIAVGVVHGVLFWMIRHRQRRIRQELIESIRDMLVDRIKNELSIVVVAATDRQTAGTQDSIQAALDASREISRTLDRLSLDALRRWKQPEPAFQPPLPYKSRPAVAWP